MPYFHYTNRKAYSCSWHNILTTNDLYGIIYAVLEKGCD